MNTEKNKSSAAREGQIVVEKTTVSRTTREGVVVTDAAGRPKEAPAWVVRYTRPGVSVIDGVVREAVEETEIFSTRREAESFAARLRAAAWRK